MGFDSLKTDIFNTDLDFIQGRIKAIDPLSYGKSRNFVDGAVTYLSPYISRGVISTKQVLMSVLNRGHTPNQIEKFIQELAWRDYWQQIWIAKGDDINRDLKRPQPDVEHDNIPTAVVQAKTGIEAIDNAITEFYKTGYLHNHVRMYIAAICCNAAKSHWSLPAKWMYYHLLDGDWASNTLSWQWVAGANANKKYFANQENINKYCYSDQRGSYLDVSYSEIAQISIPNELVETTNPALETPFPERSEIMLDEAKPTLIYNYYNLDPSWRSDIDANRILLIEPSIFNDHPISKNSIDFMLALTENIPGIQIHVGEFKEILAATSNEVIFKEHPLNHRYLGTEDSRDWMFDVKGYFPSFFGFWKKCKKQLQ